MNGTFELSHPALTLRYWQAVVTFGQSAVENVMTQQHWHSKYPDVIQAAHSNDVRTKHDVVLPGEIIYEIAGQPTRVDDYYADPDGQRIYAVARKRQWQEPSSAETDGLPKLETQQALLACGAFCLFMASDKSIGYQREMDLLRFVKEPDNLSSKTKLLWTVDERGAHFVQEIQPWDSFRGIVSHINISQRAIFGGEAWRTSETELTINGASRNFGYNRDFPASIMIEVEKRYQATIDFLKELKLKVTARPLGTR